jgi:hypothetical protein
MDRGLIGSVLERLVTPGGVILVCSARSVDDGRNDWLDAYNEARRYWSREADRTLAKLPIIESAPGSCVRVRSIAS